MQMSFEPETFDAVYAIEATVHAPSLEGVYSEIFRVLKPGGVFGVYEWLMTDEYDPSNPEHRAIAHGIEMCVIYWHLIQKFCYWLKLTIDSGDGISQMVKISEGLRAIKAAGFELEFNEDLAQRGDNTPWYYPIAGDLRYVRTIGDFFTIFRMTKLGRGAVHKLVGGLEYLGIAPRGTQKTADSLAIGADSLVAGAKVTFAVHYNKRKD